MIIKLISSLHKEEMPASLPPYSSTPLPPSSQIVYVMTGGTEGLFLEKVQSGEIDLNKPIYLVASGQSNSLAASMEILAYINQHEGKGKIVESVECRGAV